MSWLPQGSVIGVIVALDKGYFKDAGLDVELVRGYGGNRTANELDQGQFEIGYVDPVSIMLNRSNGGKTRLVGAINTSWPGGHLLRRQDRQTADARRPQGPDDGRRVGIAGAQRRPGLARAERQAQGLHQAAAARSRGRRRVADRRQDRSCRVLARKQPGDPAEAGRGGRREARLDRIQRPRPRTRTAAGSRPPRTSSRSGPTSCTSSCGAAYRGLRVRDRQSGAGGRHDGQDVPDGRPRRGAGADQGDHRAASRRAGARSGPRISCATTAFVRPSSSSTRPSRSTAR